MGRNPLIVGSSNASLASQAREAERRIPGEFNRHEIDAFASNTADLAGELADRVTTLEAKVARMTHPVDDVLVAAARAALDELERLHGLHSPKYKGKLGEPDLDVIRSLRSALRPYRRRKAPATLSTPKTSHIWKG